MKIILTHEQADFDALAALLGAYLLDEHATPALPRRINRNARSFVNAYQADLPFVDVRNLPNEPIDSVLLVDTQSLNTIKGMSQKTRVTVIDHHPMREDLPEDWTVSVYKLGATTTRLVEDLREQNGHLNIAQATLLLLGIYEDTGSLTYVSTTPRDVRAAAYLLEQGASLRIANKYLNPPLSPEQRQVYDNLLSSAETHVVHEQGVVIARVQVDEMTEEISSVAHKMRDLMDPDALFLLVQSNEGVRLVARSTTDQINVAAIAAYFGGGGHDRAAGALMQPEDLQGNDSQPPLEQAYQELVNILPRYVNPPISVQQIMSPRPLVISADTKAQKAADLMRRYGYEGYPVVEGGKVIGLLTRRAVDRALSHKLNLNARSLMDAGEVSVQPLDSLAEIQRVMNDSGWGQVPVTDAASGEVVGIVTRTDLLKTLAGREQVSTEKQNLAERLEAALPAARLALLQSIAAAAHERHSPIYIVGGFVRDLLLERPGEDFDIVVEGDAIALGRALARKFGGRIVSHGRFGTAKWQIGEVCQSLAKRLPSSEPLDPGDLPDALDLISSRTEFYDYPTALPTVERSSIKLDLHRRDFTINTLALRLDGRHYGELYDYWGGLSDLQRGIVRVLHSLSFVDDPTRILRAVRFEQRFNFRIDNRTMQLILEAQDMLGKVSGQRIHHELDLMLAESRPAEMLARLEELGLLRAIHPDLTWHDNLTEPLRAVLLEPLESEWDLPGEFGRIPTRQALAYLVWLSGLTEESIAGISERLRLHANLTSALLAAGRIWRSLPSLVGAGVSEVVDQLDHAPLVSLYALYRLTASPQTKELLRRYALEWRKVQPHVDGVRLRELGLKPGPIYRHVLETLRKAWLDGEITTEEQEAALLQHLIQALGESGE